MSSIVVRAPRRQDAAAVARVHTDSWRETYAGLVPERFYDADALRAREQGWTRSLSRDVLPERLAVAERDGEIVGFAQAGDAVGEDAEKGFTPARPLHLFTLYVLAEAHGSGAGQQLLDAVTRGEPAQLWVADGNARAIRFYERNGFRADGARFEDPRLDGLVELRMVR